MPSTVSAADHAIDLGDPVGGIDRLRLVLLRLARQIRTHSNGSITPSQMVVLGTIARHERLTIGRIAELERVQPPSASKIVSALERIGFVERTTDPDDRRCTLIAATPAGLTHVESVRAAGRTWLAERLDVLTDTDVDALGAAIPALEQLLGGVPA